MKKQSEQERKHFLHKTRNRKLKEVSRFSKQRYTVVPKRKTAARAELCFFAN